MKPFRQYFRSAKPWTCGRAYLLMPLLLSSGALAGQPVVITPLPTSTPYTFSTPTALQTPVTRGVYIREYYPSLAGRQYFYKNLQPEKDGRTLSKVYTCDSFERKSPGVFECQMLMYSSWLGESRLFGGVREKLRVLDDRIFMEEHGVETRGRYGKSWKTNSDWVDFLVLKLPSPDKPEEWTNSYALGNGKNQTEYRKAYFGTCDTEKNKYPDCIVLDTYAQVDRIFEIKREYFARSIGLVKKEFYRIDMGTTIVGSFDLQSIEDPAGGKPK